MPTSGSPNVITNPFFFPLIKKNTDLLVVLGSPTMKQPQAAAGESTKA